MEEYSSVSLATLPASRRGLTSTSMISLHEDQAQARGFSGRRTDQRERGRPWPSYVLLPHQARLGDHRGDRSDLQAMEPAEPPYQLWRPQGPSRGDGPVPDDP